MIPCHNYAHYLPTCVDSVLSQRFPGESLEVIVLDDASTDDSWAEARRYARLPNVLLIREERNQGYVRTYRRGMATARGRYVLPLDADDFVVNPDALRLQVEMIERDPRIGLVHSETREVDASGAPLGARRAWGPTGVVPSAEAFRRLLFGNSIQHTGTLIRREAYEAVGGYDERLVNSIDWDLWLRIARRFDVGYIAKPLYAYRIHARQMHQRVVASPEERRVVLDEVFLVLDRAAADVEPALRRRARSAAHLLTANAELFALRRAAGVRHLAAAVRLDPLSVARRGFWSALARFSVGLLGPRGYDLLRRALRRPT